MLTICGKGHGAGKIVEKEIPRSAMSVIQAYLPERDLILNKYGNRYHDSLIVPPFMMPTRFQRESAS